MGCTGTGGLMAGGTTKKLFFLPLLLAVILPLAVSAQQDSTTKAPVQEGVQRRSFEDGGLQHLDTRIMVHLSEGRTQEQTGFFLFVSKYNNLVNVAVPAGVFAAGVIGNDKGTRQNSLYIASSSAVNLVATFLIKQLVRRPRPFLGKIKVNAVYYPGSTSFPSGHASSSFTTATALSQVYSKWYVIAPSYLWAGSVSYSRMYLGVHYPTDVAAGALLGTGTALSMKFIQPNH